MMLLLLLSCSSLLIMEKSGLLIYVIYVWFLCMLTVKRKFFKRCVCFQCISKVFCSCFSNFLPFLFLIQKDKHNQSFHETLFSLVSAVEHTTQTELCECCIFHQRLTPQQWSRVIHSHCCVKKYNFKHVKTRGPSNEREKLTFVCYTQ